MPAKKQKQRITMKPVEAPVLKLTPEDLQEFHLRQTTLNNARFQSLMVEEAFQQWTKGIRARYDIPTAKFSIDPVTGVLTPQGDRNG